MRTTGLGIDPLRGSTAYKNIYGAADALSSAVKAMRSDYDYRQKDARAAANLIWLTKIPLSNQLFNRMVSSQLPESNR